MTTLSPIRGSQSSCMPRTHLRLAAARSHSRALNLWQGLFSSFSACLSFHPSKLRRAFHSSSLPHPSEVQWCRSAAPASFHQAQQGSIFWQKCSQNCPSVLLHFSCHTLTTPIKSHVHDQAGMALLESWLESLFSSLEDWESSGHCFVLVPPTAGSLRPI